MDKETYIYMRKANGAAETAAQLATEYDSVSADIDALNLDAVQQVAQQAEVAKTLKVDAYLKALEKSDPIRFEQERRLPFSEQAIKAGA